MTPEEKKQIAREENNRYLREWRRKNPEKNKEYITRYWNNKANAAPDLKEVKKENGE